MSHYITQICKEVLYEMVTVIWLSVLKELYASGWVWEAETSVDSGSSS